jgi:hypothetical protein
MVTGRCEVRNSVVERTTKNNKKNANETGLSEEASNRSLGMRIKRKKKP